MEARLKSVPKAVLFDMDGTMFDTERLGWEGMEHALNSYGYRLSSDMAIQLIGLTYPAIKQALLSEFGPDTPVDEIFELRHLYMDEHVKRYGVPEKVGLRRLLAFLVENQIKIAVVSANDCARVHKFLSMAGLEPYIDAVTCAQELIYPKPHPEAYLKTANKLALLPSECLVIEDSPVGATAGIRAGMQTIVIPDMLAGDETTLSGVFAVYSNLLKITKLLSDTKLRLGKNQKKPLFPKPALLNLNL